LNNCNIKKNKEFVLLGIVPNEIYLKSVNITQDIFMNDIISASAEGKTQEETHIILDLVSSSLYGGKYSTAHAEIDKYCQEEQRGEDDIITRMRILAVEEGRENGISENVILKILKNIRTCDHTMDDLVFVPGDCNSDLNAHIRLHRIQVEEILLDKGYVVSQIEGYIDEAINKSSNIIANVGAAEVSKITTVSVSRKNEPDIGLFSYVVETVSGWFRYFGGMFGFDSKKPIELNSDVKKFLFYNEAQKNPNKENIEKENIVTQKDVLSCLNEPVEVIKSIENNIEIKKILTGNRGINETTSIDNKKQNHNSVIDTTPLGRVEIKIDPVGDVYMVDQCNIDWQMLLKYWDFFVFGVQKLYIGSYIIIISLPILVELLFRLYFICTNIYLWWRNNRKK